MCVACATARQAAPSEKIITETRVETVFQTDTVFLEVPKIVEKIVTADTVSFVTIFSTILGTSRKTVSV